MYHIKINRTADVQFITGSSWQHLHGQHDSTFVFMIFIQSFSFTFQVTSMKIFERETKKEGGIYQVFNVLQTDHLCTENPYRLLSLCCQGLSWCAPKLCLKL